MNAEQFIDSNYHTNPSLDDDILIEDKTGNEVSFSEIAESYYDYKLSFLKFKNVDKKYEIQDIRKKLWVDIVTAYVSSSNSLDKENASEWADYILNEFDERFT